MNWVATLLIVSLLTSPPSTFVDTSWDGFLGGRHGIAAGGANLPLEWSPESRLWAVAVPGYGQSSPVVHAGKIFLTTTEGPEKDQYHVLCLNPENGEQEWKTSIKNSAPFKNSVYVSRAAPTPVVDDQGVYTFFESGDVLACSLTGEVLWQKNLSEMYGPIQAEFGLAASPCHDEGHLFILVEQEEGSNYLVALDKKSGDAAWKQDREARSSWTSPVMVEVDGEAQIVVSSKGSIEGYRPSDGKLLWTFDQVDGNTGTTPVDVGKGRFLQGASGGRGEPSPLAKESNGLMQIQKIENGFELKRLWVAEDASVSWASPVAHDGYAYWVNRVGVLQCYDMETGESVYQERLPESCWATPLPAGDHLYFFGKTGQVGVVKAGPVFDLVAENTTWNKDEIVEAELAEETDEQRRASAAMFGGPVLYGYAVMKDRLIMRIGNQVFCVGSR